MLAKENERQDFTHEIIRLRTRSLYYDRLHLPRSLRLRSSNAANAMASCYVPFLFKSGHVQLVLCVNAGPQPTTVAVPQGWLYTMNRSTSR